MKMLTLARYSPQQSRRRPQPRYQVPRTGQGRQQPLAGLPVRLPGQVLPVGNV